MSKDDDVFATSNPIRILAPISIWVNQENEIRCSHQCFFYDEAHCTLFNETLTPTNTLPYRCDACLSSESLLYNVKQAAMNERGNNE